MHIFSKKGGGGANIANNRNFADSEFSTYAHPHRHSSISGFMRCNGCDTSSLLNVDVFNVRTKSKQGSRDEEEGWPDVTAS